MGFEERQQIIRELQEVRETKIIAHMNSDRRVAVGSSGLPALRTKLGTEAQPFFYKALQELGKHPQLDLYLYTGGGQTDSVWPLVSLFREFGDQFNVLVPYKAHSAGTLICLGANAVVMGDAGELSPVDPKVGSQFNPVDEIEGKSRRAISVEEVTSYFDLAKDPAKDAVGNGIEDSDVDSPAVDPSLAFQILAEKVHPLALGNVNRSHKQIRELARRLLGLHYVAESSQTGETERRIRSIVNALTQGRYSHTDILNRREARSLLGEEVVKFADEAEQDLMWRLFEEYADAISLLKTFVLQSEIGDSQQAEIKVAGAFIETEATSYIYRSICRVTQRSALPSGFQVNLQSGQLMPLIPGFPREMNIELKEIGWVKNEEGI